MIVDTPQRNLLTSQPAFALWLALGLLAGCSQTEMSPAPQIAVAPDLTGSSGSPLSAAGQDLLRTGIGSSNSAMRWPDFRDYTQQVRQFYALNNSALWWVKDSQPTPQALQAIALFLHADRKGLSAEDYDGARWSARVAGLKPATARPAEANAVQFDLALTVCLMRYISDLHIGKVNPKRLDFAFDQASKRYDLPGFLKDRVVGAPDVAVVLAEVEPPYPGYRRVLQALQNYAEFAGRDDGEVLPPVSKALAPGDSYAGTPRLTRLLRLLGDLPAEAEVPAGGIVYSTALVDAVKQFQRRHGRDPNGRIGAQTVADLNVPIAYRVQQMRSALERWRWMPESYQGAPIIVNIPEFRLRAYDKDFNVAVTMNVVVGSSFGHDTPVFADSMSEVVFRPYWAVPLSIVRADLIPHILKDASYLNKKGLEIVDSRQKVAANAMAARDTVKQLRAGKLFIRQLPGPGNALGLVMFRFPNSYSVYMHDTPALQYFAKSRRDFSHGCIRLEKPAELAAWVLRDNPGWNPERIHAAMNGDATQQVNLAHPIPVLIVYLTTVVLEDGLVHFFDDIYGHDKALQQALAKGYPYPE